MLINFQEEKQDEVYLHFILHRYFPTASTAELSPYR